MRLMSGLLVTAALTVILVFAARRAGLFTHVIANTPAPKSAAPAGLKNAPVLFQNQQSPHKTVCVAAIQCASKMGKLTRNRELLTQLIKSAAAHGAKIVVLPECALQGYMDPACDIKWSRKLEGAELSESELSVDEVAQTVPGSATRDFGALCRSLKIYLALPLIEVEHQAQQRTYYNTLVLLDPNGKIAAHHRKHSLWAPGDGGWVTESRDEPQVVDTPYGRLGLMICHDIHVLPPQLKAARADIVLYSVGWYGPNTENWFREIFPRRYLVPNHFAIVAANWCASDAEKTSANGWQGQGFSCIIERNGRVMAMAGESNQAVITAELQIHGLSDTAMTSE